jgi:hypothetical protein
MILLTAMTSVAGSSLFGQAIQSSGRVSVPQARVDSQPVRAPVVEGKGVRFTHLPAAQGLSQVRVAQIIQDPRGFLWFGTQVGVNRYDGYNLLSAMPEVCNA